MRVLGPYFTDCDNAADVLDWLGHTAQSQELDALFAVGISDGHAYIYSHPLTEDQAERVEIALTEWAESAKAGQE